MIGFRADRVLKENPKPGHPYWSPRKIRLTNRAYCTGHGWSSPNWWRTSATSSGVGCRPAKMTAGSLEGMTKKIM